MTMTNSESTTWLDRFPTEIIFHVFDYLSSNDIIYTFFFFSQRFNNLLLQNQRYLIHVELPTTNLNLWEIIFSHIGSQIESLNISTIDLSFPLSLFPNLKSLIVSSSYGLLDEQLDLILESDQLNNLHSLKIKQNKICSNPFDKKYLITQDDIFKKILNHKNSLKTFQYSSKIQSLEGISIDALETNFNLHSLTLILPFFQNIYSIIEYTPNLTYLNITTDSFRFGQSRSIKKVNIKLKQLYLKLVDIIPITHEDFYTPTNFDLIINRLKPFLFSSLICLSLDLAKIIIRSENDFPRNSIPFQQFLESMPELKQFHLYALLNSDELDPECILETFNAQFWSDHNWSFGMHDQYLYTLPFDFDQLYLYGSFKFDDVKSNNPEILETNPRLWYHVKSIGLHLKPKFDLNFVKELKMKMPKLTKIKFYFDFSRSSNEIQDLRDRATVQLDSVTTVHFTQWSLLAGADWLVYVLPNVKNLILSSQIFPSVDMQLAPILNRQIEQLYIDMTDVALKNLAETNYVHFSNVQHIYLDISKYHHSQTYQWYTDLVMKILKNFESLKILVINMPLHKFRGDMAAKLCKFTEHLDMNESLKNYQVKQNPVYSIFSRKNR